MFFKFNSAFLLILIFCLDPWKNKYDTFLIVKITFTKLRLLGVKCIFILFIFNNTLPVNDWGEAVGQPRDLWSKPGTHCFTIVAFFGHCERPWKLVLQGSWWYFCPPAQVLQNSSPKNFWHGNKEQRNQSHPPFSVQVTSQLDCHFAPSPHEPQLGWRLVSP